MNDVLMIVFGWALGWTSGLVSPLIVDWLKKPGEMKSLMQAIKSEAKETRYRLAMSAYILKTEYDEPDREFFEWALEKFKTYDGPEKKMNIELFEKMRNVEGEQFDALWNVNKAQAGKGVSLKTFPTSFLEANLHLAGTLPLEFQSRLHTFWNRRSALNEQITDAKKRHEMTFDSSISEANHKTISDDIVREYKSIANQCRFAVDMLDQIIAFRNPSFLGRLGASSFA